MVYPNEETLLTPPFNLIWNRDESTDKWLAMREFTYIEFMTSQLKSNPYKGYSEKVREKKLREDILENPEYEPDNLVLQAMEKIEEMQTEGSPNYTLYKDCLATKERVQKLLTTIDLNERTRSGGAVFKPKDIMDAIEKASSVAESLSNLKKKVEEDIFDTVKTRANKVISPFANPDSIS